MRNYELTRRQFLNNLYSHMKERVTNPRKSVEGRSYLGRPICTREGFIEFGLSSAQFNRLFKRYKRSKGKRSIAPSIDRIRTSGGYTLGNMQFLTLSVNSNKDKKPKTIVLKSLDTKKVYRFATTSEVGVFLNHRREVKVTRPGFVNVKTGERFVNLSNR